LEKIIRGLRQQYEQLGGIIPGTDPPRHYTPDPDDPKVKQVEANLDALEQLLKKAGAAGDDGCPNTEQTPKPETPKPETPPRTMLPGPLYETVPIVAATDGVSWCSFGDGNGMRMTITRIAETGTPVAISTPGGTPVPTSGGAPTGTPPLASKIETPPPTPRATASR
jgi:hypothetical protein